LIIGHRRVRHTRDARSHDQHISSRQQPVADATIILRLAGPAILSRSTVSPLAGTPWQPGLRAAAGVETKAETKAGTGPKNVVPLS
jgi:hypothetical protein